MYANAKPKPMFTYNNNNTGGSGGGNIYCDFENKEVVNYHIEEINDTFDSSIVPTQSNGFILPKPKISLNNGRRFLS